MARRVSKKDNNKIIKIQYVCQCIRHEEAVSVPPAAVSPAQVEETSEEICEEDETFEEYEYDGYMFIWDKETNVLLDPDDCEVMGKMIEKDGEWVPMMMDDDSDDDSDDDTDVEI